MESHKENFVDFLAERRKDCDIKWASRYTEPLPAHVLPIEWNYNRKQAIAATLGDTNVTRLMKSIAEARNVPLPVVVAEAKSILEEMASKSHLPTVRWLGN